MLARKTQEASGWVNFPLQDPRYCCTGEGGMVVKLVAVDEAEASAPEHFARCFGAHVHDVLGALLAGDDRRPRPRDVATEEMDRATLMAAIDQEERAQRHWLAHHYPSLHGPGQLSDAGRLISREYLAAIVVGTTGWSGCERETGEFWHCRYQDLTQEGRRLYEQLRTLYPHATLHLLTYLDT
jgi:hypothetical protein